MTHKSLIFTVGYNAYQDTFTVVNMTSNWVNKNYKLVKSSQ